MSDQVRKFKELESNFKYNDCQIFYLLSKEWFEQWKQKHGYDQDSNPGIHLGHINEDIGCKNKSVLKYEPLDSHMWNTHLKPNVTDDQFIAINQDMWKFFKQNHKVEYCIERDSYLNENNERIINVHLKKIRFVPFYPTTLQKQRNMRKENLIEGYQYVGNRCTANQYIELLEKTLKTVTSARFLDKDSVRLYRLPPEWTLQMLTDYVHDKIQALPQGNDIRFDFPDATFIEPSDNTIFEDFQEEQILIMDAKQSHYTWVINNDKFPLEEKCPQCTNYKILSVQCECKKITYCSEMCRSKDEYSHLQTCDKQDDTDEVLLSLIKTNDSKMGLCGLRNLGNTCYMNSAIQCLSHAFEITRHFLDNSFKLGINYQNPLGSKGKFVSNFAYLMKRLWLDSKTTYSPYAFKKLIALLQPNYAGTNQQDSQEFLTFVLDLLHEDLNRIVNKPYVEIPDNGNRPESEIAEEQWQMFKKRNDSVIVDNLYGQYRSKLECPDCHNISITYDPFVMVSVSIPQETRKFIRLDLIDQNNPWKLREEQYYYDPIYDPKLKDVLDEKSNLWFNCNWDEIIFTCSSIYTIEEVFIDELLHFIKKKLHSKQLFIRKLTEQEKQVPLESRIQVLVHQSFLYSGTNNWKRDLLPPTYYIYSQSTTYKELHLQMYNQYIEVLKSFPDFKQEWLEMNQTEVYEKEILDKFWKIEFKTNQRFNVDCSYCYKSYCVDCPLSFTDKVLGDCLERGDKLIQPEYHIIWLKPLNITLEDLFSDYQKKIQSNYKLNAHEKKDKYKKSFTLEQCLEYSAQSEQLSLENSWYCKICCDFVQAHKTLQMYKTPSILIFHLKRFKDSSYKLFKSKLQTKVIFPVEELDITNLICSHQEGSKYELFAVCNHIGESGAGHYTAFCLNQKCWYKFDDAYVTKYIQDIVTEEAYVLFYRRKGTVDNYQFQEIFDKNYAKVKEIIEQEAQLEQARVQQQKEREEEQMKIVDQMLLEACQDFNNKNPEMKKTNNNNENQEDNNNLDPSKKQVEEPDQEKVPEQKKQEPDKATEQSQNKLENEGNQTKKTYGEENNDQKEPIKLDMDFVNAHHAEYFGERFDDDEESYE